MQTGAIISDDVEEQTEQVLLHNNNNLEHQNT